MKITKMVIATACILIGFPANLLKMPWLPSTISIFFQTITEFSVVGTASYDADRAMRLQRLSIALLLYALGIYALIGLCLIVAREFRSLTERSIWLSAFVVGLGLPLFERPHIGPGTDHFYVVSLIYLPLVVAALSLVGFACSFLSRRTHSDATNVA
jgi:hypothetical protein